MGAGLAPVISTVELPGMTPLRRGKVRDTFDLGDALLMVASDRISAFDVILPTPIPLKGIILTQLSRYWFEETRHIVPNHLITASIQDFPDDLKARNGKLAGRSMIVRKAERIDFECVVRGYLAGSGWAEYQRAGTVADLPVAPGLRQAEQLPEPVFTPAMKNDEGHDENISIQRLRDEIGVDLATRLEDVSLQLYSFAADHARRRGIVLADTKFEFGFVNGELTLIDEALTPDSSRFWDASTYEPGHDQPSFDKQFVRDWLLASGWDKEPPAPELPGRVVTGTSSRYHEAFKRLTGRSLWYETLDG
ncbi:MAG: phosphoribosylaminoimidazolesuccinocarboxamide synthase [Thermomicrobiales bacterium]|nr:phosphoribosylaminoimidazolesuccinocarboxamide synthase [Thermomicrobiales bacterium]